MQSKSDFEPSKKFYQSGLVNYNFLPKTLFTNILYSVNANF